jgi:hypothetical protein
MADILHGLVLISFSLIKKSPQFTGHHKNI